MNQPELELLLEAAATPYRERDPEGRTQASPAWWDLPAEARAELFDLQARSREIEKALHPRGWSGTVSAVMSRLS